MERVQRAVCKNCFDPKDCELREQLTKLIVLYGGSTSRDDAPERAEPREPPRGQGLCGSCIHRSDCAKQAVEGGVWHCADYA